MFGRISTFISFVILILLNIQIQSSNAGLRPMKLHMHQAKEVLIESINATKYELNESVEKINIPQLTKNLSKLDKMCYNLMLQYATHNSFDILWALDKVSKTLNETVLESARDLDTIILCAQEQNIADIKESYKPVLDYLYELFNTVDLQVGKLINNTEDLSSFILNITDRIDGCLRFIKDTQTEPTLLIKKVIGNCFDQTVNDIIPKCQELTFDTISQEENIIKYLEDRNYYIRNNFQHDIDKIHNQLLIEKNFDVDTCGTSIWHSYKSTTV